MIFFVNKRYLQYCSEEINKVCNDELNLELNQKTQIEIAYNDIDFLLNKEWENILKNKSIIDEEYINMRINSFKAHLKYSNEKCDKLLSNIK